MKPNRQQHKKLVLLEKQLFGFAGKRIASSLIELTKQHALLTKPAKKRAVDSLIKRAKCSNETGRAGAIYVLGELHDPRAVKQLINSLNDKVNWVRWHASQSLAKIALANASSNLKPVLQTAGRRLRSMYYDPLLSNLILSGVYLGRISKQIVCNDKQWRSFMEQWNSFMNKKIRKEMKLKYSESDSFDYLRDFIFSKKQ